MRLTPIEAPLTLRPDPEILRGGVVIELEVQNTIVAAQGAVRKLIATLSDLDEKTAEGLRLAVLEMVMNAIEHGNLGIGYEEKSNAKEEGRFEHLIEERSRQAQREQRKVYIRLERKPDEIIVVIRDDGEGFDSTKLPDPFHPANVERQHGRGVMLARAFLDEVRYNSKGNEVTLVKRL